MSDRAPSTMGTRSPIRSRQTSISSVTDSEGSSRKQSPATERAPTVVGYNSPNVETWKPLKNRQSSSTTIIESEGRNKAQTPPVVRGLQSPSVETWKSSSIRHNSVLSPADSGVSSFTGEEGDSESMTPQAAERSPRPKSTGVTWNPKLVESEFKVEKDVDQVEQKSSKETAKIVMGPSVEMRKGPTFPKYEQYYQEFSGIRTQTDGGRFSSVYVPARTTERSQK
ncbi:hypothetical protein L9F63_002276, partial [Diploptera punctata]